MAGEAEQLRLRSQLSRLRSLPLLRGAKLSGELERLQRQLDRITSEPSDEEIWRSVELARHPERPYTLDYVERLLDDWFELHGDHHHGDDAALVAGLGRFRGRTIVLVGNQKGRDVKERTRRNFGMAYPEGYGKAMRAMELAERHGFPLLSLVDIPGAYPGVTAEQHGQGGAIARSQALLSRLHVPVVTCVIGEGGSGGALAIAACNTVLMLEHAIYTVASPEAAASILWRDSSRAQEAATGMKITAQDLIKFGIVDGVIPEPLGGAHRDPAAAIAATGQAISDALKSLHNLGPDELRDARAEKYLAMGRKI
jgi:acetyl-CoA carboxylase carboxyl transferase subunit alpha